MTAFPWKLRLQHLGGASVRVEHPSGVLAFDPADVPDEGAVVLVTRADPITVLGTLEAVRQGRHPRVIADEEVLHWLSRHGAVSGDVLPVSVDGVALAALGYRAPPRGLVRTVRALGAPRAAVKRAHLRAILPPAEPFAVEVTFPAGARLVHLGRALHARQDPSWLERASKRFHRADWLVAGVEPGQHETFFRQVARFAPRRVLVADLVSDPSARARSPRPVTPIVDRLIESGVEAYVFAREASLRFE